MTKPVVIAGAGVIGCILGHVLKKHDIPFCNNGKKSGIQRDPPSYSSIN